MWGGIFDKNNIKEKVNQFDIQISEESFWKDQLLAQKILKEKKFFGEILKNFNYTVNELDNIE